MSERLTSGETYLIPDTFAPYINNAFERLSRSSFRSRFRLSEKDRAYYDKCGRDKVAEHAARFIEERLAPAYPKNDGRQTPMRGHPAFTAQHATACCCRSCLEKWYRIPRGRALTDVEKLFCVALIMTWIDKQISPD